MDFISIGTTVLVSFLLFFIPYRMTIGAKKERVSSTYSEIVRILFRNLVNDNRFPTISEMKRIIQTKSIENKIKTTDLPEEEIFINAVYTKVVENEIISSERKKELTSKINNHIKKIEKKPPYITPEEEKEPLDTEASYKILLALLSMFIAIGVSLISFSFMEISTLILAGVTMTIVLATTAALLRLKEEQEESGVSRTSMLKKYRKFENQITKILEGFGRLTREPELKKDNKIIRPDFSLEVGRKTFLIEAKMLRPFIPKSLIERLNTQAEFAKSVDKNFVLILVVKNKRYLIPYLDRLKAWDFIFDENELREFRNKLVHGSAIPRFST